MKLFYLAPLFFFFSFTTTVYSQTYSLGDIVDFNSNMEFSIEEVGEWNSYHEWYKPDKGNKYCYVLVYIKNTGSETISYNPTQFSLKDSKGFEYTGTLVQKKPRLTADELLPDDITRGYITYEIPKESSGLKIYYDNSMWTSDDLIRIKLSK